MLFDGVQDLILGVGGAGEQVLVREDHAGQGGGVFGQDRHVDDPADIDPAVADKDAHPGGLAGDVDLRRQLPHLDLGAPGRSQELARRGRGRRGLHHRLGDVLGGLEDAADIDAFLVGVHGREG